MIIESNTPKRITFDIEANFDESDLQFLFTLDTPKPVSILSERKNGKVYIHIPPIKGVPSGEYEGRLDAISENASYLQTEWREKITYKARRGRPSTKSPVEEYEEIIETTQSGDVEGSQQARIGDKVFRRFTSLSPSGSIEEADFNDLLDVLLEMPDDVFTDDNFIRFYNLLNDLMVTSELDDLEDSPSKQLDEIRKAKKSSQRQRRLSRVRYRRRRSHILQKRKLMKKSARGKTLLRKRKQMAKSNRTATGNRKVSYNRQDGSDRRRNR